MQLFQIQIGPRDNPRLSFEAIAPDSCTAVAQHRELAHDGERMDVKALRQATDDYSAEMARLERA